ncbi:ArsR family transcriptional regulator [Tamaricihabitans halophyticus]|uniref:ArsR family transcriptional regulator n=1 Tax=Tamaricihabitans halophyticus TaxID=1262583 RepID=A0A4V2SRM4_9PSEU|nr:metalloregulator ArsR/SmtB family transcription factor [Tamaricihabitans halophyticus]TCP43416.1 ArsR family transcriptional regulator [Tamaricihabitans halophyticus]
MARSAVTRTSQGGEPAQPPSAPARPLRDQYVQVMKALADPVRLDMLRLIGSGDEYACTALETELPVGKSTISYHVKILNHAGLLSVQRRGRNFFYTVHKDVLDFYAPGILERLALALDSE